MRVLLHLVLLLTPALAAQESTGKLQGTVRDSAGAPLPSAQVLLVGATFGTTADERGYYFLNNVPIGTYAVRAQLIGRVPVEIRGVRILGGQTLDLDLTLAAAAVTVSGVTVLAADNPIVPRDQVTTKTIVSGALLNDLPVSDVRDLISLQPGVVAGQNGLSLRGSRPEEAQIYIDGAPVRSLRGLMEIGVQSTDFPFFRVGEQPLQVGTNALEELSVTTGAMGVEVGNAQAGIITYGTRSGGATYHGSVAYETDEPFSNATSLGLNRFEGSLGGPVPGMGQLRFFGSSTLQGRKAPETGWGWDQVPSYLVGGIDTVVMTPARTDSLGVVLKYKPVAVPRYEQVTGRCPQGGDATNPVRDAMLHNYGHACRGGQLPLAWETIAQLQGKLLYSYGQGSSVSLTGLANGTQSRFWPGTAIGDPALFGGLHSWSRAVIANVQHQVFRRSDRALSLHVNLSWQQDNLIQGPLDSTYEASSRTPALGLELGAVRFGGFDPLPFPITEAIVNNFRTNRGLRSPLQERRDALKARQPYRLNPYAMEAGGWWTEGVYDVFAATLRETRRTARVTVDWQANRLHRLTLGAEGLWSHVAEWRGFLQASSATQVIVNSPVLYGAFAADRLDVGDLVLELGLRLDYFNTHALYPNLPGTIYTGPQWSPDAATDPDSLAASIGRAYSGAAGHTAISPRLRVSFPVNERTDFRLSYGKQVQAPDFLTLLRGTNVEGGFLFGRDISFGETLIAEFGIRHAFGRDLVLDVSAYNKSIRSEPTFRSLPYDIPTNVGSTNIEYRPVLTAADFGNTKGIDVKFDWRVGQVVNASLAYTLQASRGTGSDPRSNSASAQFSQITGLILEPPQAVQTTDFDRPHNLVGTLVLTVPRGSRAASALGGVLGDVKAFAAFRLVSGLPYTRDRYNGVGTIAPPGSVANDRLEPVNSSRLPPMRVVDLRVSKDLTISRVRATAYLDARNVFNFRNTNRLFSETGGVVNAKHRDGLVSPELTGIANRADFEQALLGNGSVDVRGCGRWSDPLACVTLNRAEARFGDGDGIYTVTEQGRALDAWYQLVSGPQTLYGSPRRVRVGIELSF